MTFKVKILFYDFKDTQGEKKEQVLKYTLPSSASKPFFSLYCVRLLSNTASASWSQIEFSSPLSMFSQQ